jgi:hypothetical protein
VTAFSASSALAEFRSQSITIISYNASTENLTTQQIPSLVRLKKHFTNTRYTAYCNASDVVLNTAVAGFAPQIVKSIYAHNEPASKVPAKLTALPTLTMSTTLPNFKMWHSTDLS